jgi:hypothetical protein
VARPNNGIEGDGKKPPRLIPGVRCHIANEDIGVAITSIFVYDKQNLLIQKILS